MKSIITLSAVPVLAALVLVGCNQNNPGNSTDTQSTNASGTMGGATNLPATNSLPDMKTNVPAGSNLSAAF